MFIYSFNKYVLSVCHVPDTAPGASGAMGSKTDKVPSVMELMCSLGDIQ